MKILCKVLIERNQCAQLTTPKQQSTLALSCETGASCSYMTIFNNEYKQGLRYKLNNNVATIFKKFIEQGKSTIVLRDPKHSIFVESSDAFKLKLFVQAIEVIAANKVTNESRLFLPAIAKPMSAKKVVKRLKVKKKDDIPTGGLPKTLEFLIVNDFDCNLQLKTIAKLRNLTELTMSAANLITLPKEFGQLSKLRFCDLTSNQIATFDWLNGSLQNNLTDLNLSDNRIREFPKEICFVENLRSLNLSDNRIEKVPRFIHNLKKLSNLNLSYNEIEYLPASIAKLPLKQFDVYNNKFRMVDREREQDVELTNTKSLVDLAAAVVAKHCKYEKRDLPVHLYNYLKTAVECVTCNRFVFDSHIRKVSTSSFATLLPRTTISYSHQINDVYVEFYFCSSSCRDSPCNLLISYLWT